MGRYLTSLAARRFGVVRLYLPSLLVAVAGCRGPSTPATFPVARSPAGPPASEGDCVSSSLLKTADRLSVSFARSSRQQQLALAKRLERCLASRKKRFALHWRLARCHFLVAQLTGSESARLETAKTGASYARQAVQLRPKRVEGHYYLALNLAKVSEVRRELKLIKPLVRVAKAAVARDPTFDHAGPLVLLGTIYLRAPGWPLSVGDAEKAIALLRRALQVSPRPATHFYLAQAYDEEGQVKQARSHMRQALLGAGQLPPQAREAAQAYLRK